MSNLWGKEPLPLCTRYSRNLSNDVCMILVKVIRRSDNKLYALKRVKIGEMAKREIDDALSEIRFLASIRHKNIVGFLEAYTGTLRSLNKSMNDLILMILKKITEVNCIL